VPGNNIVDNLTWKKGTHTLVFVGSWRLIQNNRGSDANSYSYASTNPYWYVGGPPDPAATLGEPAVSGGFANSYEIAYGNLIGGVPDATTVSNYNVNPEGGSGSLLADGTFINRHFKANEFEWSVQDAWRARYADPKGVAITSPTQPSFRSLWTRI
jgi:hypothetical protein